MLKLIFLDVDGVLNNTIDSDRHYYNERGYFYSPNCVKVFNKVIEATGAKIVVSSTWRLGRTVEELKELFAWMGVKGEVIDKTGRNSSGIRGVEILEWMRERDDIHSWNFKNYIIIDDDSDMLLWQKDNFVHTKGTIGITEQDVEKAIRILNQ